MSTSISDKPATRTLVAVNSFGQKRRTSLTQHERPVDGLWRIYGRPADYETSPSAVACSWNEQPDRNKHTATRGKWHSYKHHSPLKVIDRGRWWIQGAR